MWGEAQLQIVKLKPPLIHISILQEKLKLIDLLLLIIFANGSVIENQKFYKTHKNVDKNRSIKNLLRIKNKYSFVYFLAYHMICNLIINNGKRLNLTKPLLRNT